MRRGRPWFALVAVAGIATAACGTEPICDSAELTSTLEEAPPGTTVEVGACRLYGSFSVGPGVTLVGAGRGLTVLASEGARPALRMIPGTPAASVHDLTVESNANSGLLLRGPGEAIVERVDVMAFRGIAVAAEGVDVLTLIDVRIAGPVLPANEATFPPLATPAETATHGLVLVDVPSANLSNVTASGFAGFGALLVESATVWVGGGARGNLGTGLMVYGGYAMLEDLDVSHTLGEARLIPSYGAVFAAGATVETLRLDASYGRNFGVLNDAATVRHVDLDANYNVEAGVWAQSCPSFEVSGTDVNIRGNGLGGIIALDSGAFAVSGANVMRTDLLPSVFGESGRVDLGAGIELVRPQGPVTLRDVTLSRNAQVGLLIHLASGTALGAVTFENVTVAGLGGQLGAVAQGGTVAAGWDAGITRDATTTDNDAARTGMLDRAGPLGTENMPAATAVADGGLNALIDPDPPF